MSTVTSTSKPCRFRENLIALFGVQAANYIMPLLTIPYLTRVLRPEGWGEVAFVQSLGFVLITVMEYGFTLSAARDISVRRDDRSFVQEQFGAVTVAKMILALIALLIAMTAFHFVIFLRTHPRMFLAGLVWAAAQGTSPLWLYQGLERMRLPSAVDFCWKMVGMGALFIFVTNPATGPIVLMIYATVSACSTATLYTMALMKHGIVAPSRSDVLRVLREGLPVFILQVSVSMYTTANVFVLGLLAPQYEVGLYAGAERVSKSLLGLLGPLNQALYPRMNANVHLDKQSASKVVKQSFYWVLGITVAIAVLAFFVAAPVISLFLGRTFSGSVPVLRILVLLLPIVGASNMLGLQWMLPLRMDRQFTTIIILGGALNVTLASVLARHLFAKGMAISAVCAELLVTLGCLLYLSRKKLNPLGRLQISLPGPSEIL